MGPYDESSPTSDLPPSGSRGSGTGWTPDSGADSIPEPIPEQIGPYRVLEQIGEGGFGMVYLAEQTEPVRRRVALKVIKLGMDTKAVIARFEAERQALAMMDHPHIARVLDAGATPLTDKGGGRPYFVMELVKGEPITLYCEKNRLGMQERLELFIKVCSAVQHAHQKGIIHRDIKPSNILVTLQDGKPSPKVIDFGIAKATTTSLTEKTVFTQHGQMVGTPEYMSPEQAESSGLDVDTRTDVYSLGVVLYRLLTGVLPFDMRALRGAGREQWLRTIRESPAPKPSTRLATSEATATLDKHTLHERRIIKKQLRGDLDWIVLKALEKDRTRRYGTAEELGRDIDRHLSNEPVSAGPPSMGYALSKFAARNRVGIAAGSVVVVAVLFGIAATVWGLLEARDAAAIARQEAFAAGQARDEANEARRIAEAAQQAEAAQRALVESQAAELSRTLHASRISRAQVALQANETADARRALLEAIESEPAWEWRYLRRAMDQARLRIDSPQGPMRCVAFTPDGRLVATGNDDGSVTIFSTIDGTLVRKFQAHGQPVSGVAFLSGGRELLTTPAPPAQGLGTLSEITPVPTVWRVATGEQVRVFEFSDVVNATWQLLVRGFNAMAVSEDGTLLLTGENNGTVRVWSIESGKEQREFKSGSDNIVGVTFGPDGRMIASADIDGDVRIIRPGRRPQSFRGHGRGTVNSIRFDPTGERLLTTSSQDAVRIWDIDDLDQEMELPAPGLFINDAAFTPGGESIITAEWTTLRIWDAENGSNIRDLHGHEQAIQTIAFSPDGRSIASIGADERLCIWDLEEGPQSGTMMLDNGAQAVAISPDGETLYTASGSRHWWTRRATGAFQLSAWDLRTGSMIGEPIEHRTSVQAVAISPDGRILACGTLAGTIVLYDATTMERLRTFQIPGLQVLALAFDGASSRLAVSGPDVSDDARIVMIDVRLGRRGSDITLPAQTEIMSLTFTPDDAGLLAGCLNGALHLLDPATGAHVDVLGVESGGMMISDLGPSGDLLGVGLGTGGVEVWNMQSRQRVARVSPREGGAVIDVAITPDGRRLAFGQANGDIRIADTGSGDVLMSLRGHIGAVTDLSFTPDGDQLISASVDHTVRQWSAMPPDDPRFAADLIRRCATLVAQGISLDEAMRLYDHALVVLGRTPERRQADTLEEMRRLATQLLRRGESERALEVAQITAEIRERAFPEDLRELGWVGGIVGAALTDTGAFPDAERQLRRVRAMWSDDDADPISIAVTDGLIACILVAQDRCAEARPTLEASFDALGPRYDIWRHRFARALLQCAEQAQDDDAITRWRGVADALR